MFARSRVLPNSRLLSIPHSTAHCLVILGCASHDFNIRLPYRDLDSLNYILSIVRAHAWVSRLKSENSFEVSNILLFKTVYHRDLHHGIHLQCLFRRSLELSFCVIVP